MRDERIQAARAFHPEDEKQPGREATAASPAKPPKESRRFSQVFFITTASTVSATCSHASAQSSSLE